MDVMAAITRNIVYPLVEWKNRSNILEYLEDYEKTQYLDKAEIEKLQWERIKNLLDHAYKNVPFYNERFRVLGMTPKDITSPADFSLLPPLTKEDVQKNFSKMLSKGIVREKLIEDYTGGTSGKPLKFYYDKKRIERRGASTIRHDRWAGWDIGEKTAVIWGASSGDYKKRSVRRKLKDVLMKRSLFLDAYNLSADKMEKFASMLESFKPTTILAYADVMEIFAIFLKDRNHNIRPKGIICSADTLTDTRRHIIESVFGCKVFDRYGSREIGLMASECEEHRGLHVNAENVHIEIVRGNKPAASGELGEILVTDLYNYVMPFIRYKIGDCAITTPEVCSCGRGLPLIESIEGRISDFVVTPQGKIICEGYFAQIFHGEEGIDQFQIIQEKIDHIVLNLIPSRKYSGKRLLEIVQALHDYLGNDVSIDIRKVEEIQKPPSGKNCSVISQVPLPFC
jgi:phenylacetate-CoA ligase